MPSHPVDSWNSSPQKELMSEGKSQLAALHEFAGLAEQKKTARE
jgi:hypothetical protein